MKLLVVNFHYVRDCEYERGIYPRSLKEISNQIDVLSKYYNFISQDDLIDKIKKKQFDKKNYCLLTFDDGLKEQMAALNLLNQKGIPGVFYVTTDSIKRQTVVNVHKLHYIRTVMTDEEIFNYISSNIDLVNIHYPKNINELYRYDSLNTKKLKYLLNFILKSELKDKLITKLFKTFEDETAFSKKLYMDIEDIQKLDYLGYLGTHSDGHLPLATLNEKEIREDINNSLVFFKETCDVDDIKSISYPYGGSEAVSQKVIDVTMDFSFDFGLTMFRGLNEIKDFGNPLLLKRVDTNDAPGGKLKSNIFCI